MQVLRNVNMVGSCLAYAHISNPHSDRCANIFSYFLVFKNIFYYNTQKCKKQIYGSLNYLK